MYAKCLLKVSPPLNKRLGLVRLGWSTIKLGKKYILSLICRLPYTSTILIILPSSKKKVRLRSVRIV